MRVSVDQSVSGGPHELAPGQNGTEEAGAPLDPDGGGGGSA